MDCEVNASERQESLLSIVRAQLNLCKVNASEWQESLLSIARAQLNLCKVNANNLSDKMITFFKKEEVKSLYKYIS